jgi:hypothetical protein
MTQKSAPSFTRETSSADTQEKRWAWMMASAEEGAREGYAYFEVVFDKKTMAVRIDGWKERPACPELF